MPIAMLSVRSDLNRLARDLGALGQKQLPFAYSQTINRLARGAIPDLQKTMEKVFDRPNRWTLNAYYARVGNKAKPTATIETRDFAGKGTPAWKYLTPEVFGGTRRMKRFERALGAKFDTGMTTPGKGAKLDQYGNISAADINRLLSALGAFPETGYLANRTAKSSKRTGHKQQTFFLAHSKSDGTPLGIYRVDGPGKVVPVLIFTHRAPQYRKRFPYAKTIEQSIAKNTDPFAREEFAKAIATAR